MSLTDGVFFDGVGTLFRLGRSVGEVYGDWAHEFGFSEGRDPATQARIQEAFSALFRAKKVPIPAPNQFLSARKLERRWWKELVEETFDSVGPVPRMAEFFETVYEMFGTSQEWILEPGCREVLTRLSAAGRKLGVISNFDSRLPDLLEDLKIAEFFDQVIVPGVAGAAKPNPLIFSYAVTKLDCDPETVVHIGDSVVDDFQGARQAGLAALLYDPYDYFASEVPNNRIKNLAEVPSLLL